MIGYLYKDIQGVQGIHGVQGIQGILRQGKRIYKDTYAKEKVYPSSLKHKRGHALNEYVIVSK